jgi:hypothetical protein
MTAVRAVQPPGGLAVHGARGERTLCGRPCAGWLVVGGAELVACKQCRALLRRRMGGRQGRHVVLAGA